MEFYEIILIGLTLSIVGADILIRLHFALERRDRSVERLLTVLGPAHKQVVEQRARQESDNELRGLVQAR